MSIADVFEVWPPQLDLSEPRRRPCARRLPPFDRRPGSVSAVAVVALRSGANWAAVYDKIVQVLAERVNIERAKGVLAVQRDIDLADAFTVLVETAARDNVPLADCAAQVLASVQRPAADHP